jgi:hypothetical protein
MTNQNLSSYPTGDAGSDSESGTVDAGAADGADQSQEHEADVTDDGSLSPVSSATGSPTSMNSELAPDAGDDHLPDVDPHSGRPDALIQGNRVATAEDME